MASNDLTGIKLYKSQRIYVFILLDCLSTENQDGYFVQ